MEWLSTITVNIWNLFILRKNTDKKLSISLLTSFCAKYKQQHISPQAVMNTNNVEPRKRGIYIEILI